MGFLPLLASFLGWMPSLGPRGFMVIAGAIILGLVGLTGYIKGSARTGEAVAETNLEWTTKLQKAKDDHATELSEVRRAAAAEPTTPADRAERVRLCRESPTCRERGSAKK